VPYPGTPKLGYIRTAPAN